MAAHIPDSDIPVDPVQRMNEVIKTCVHCGFCLSACPTYLETGSELDSPRGRIQLMKGVLAGDLPLDATVVNHIDHCLGCLGCVTACPSGVQYNELIDNFRPKLEAEYARAPMDRLTRTMLMQVLPYAGRFRLATTLGKAGKPFARFMPKPMRTMLALIPKTSPPKAKALPSLIPAQGTRRARIALLTGCVQQVLAPSINQATVNVLTRNGVEVVIPEGQNCCGALANHIGQRSIAQAFARKTLAVFPTDVDAVLTNAAGCGSTLKEYTHLMADQPEAKQAMAFSDRAQDVSQFLAELGLSAEIPGFDQSITVGYHDACHLGHAQGVKVQPRQLLFDIPNLQLVEIPEADVCCGSAGVYNITQPEMARDLLNRKVDNILSIGVELVATGNIGCLTQIQNGLAARGSKVKIMHTMEILDRAYKGGKSDGDD